MLVCLARSAECAPAFAAASGWAIQVLGTEHVDVARRFATRGADKFGAGDLPSADGGYPALADARAVLECAAFARHDGGDHLILIGRVERIRLGDGEPVVFHRRAFHRLAAIA